MNKSETTQSQNISISGIIVTILVTAGFVWAAGQWLNRNNENEGQSSTMQANEHRTLSHLQLISQAQKKYIQNDWDQDGKKTYAMYFVHLWTSLDKEKDPVAVNYISRDLGFATEAARAVDGYYFYDLHDQMVPGTGEVRPFNYEKEWCILGMPVYHGKTGKINFIADHSGNIYVNKAKYVPAQYPGEPSRFGWTKIDNLEQLQAFQKNISYDTEQ